MPPRFTKLAADLWRPVALSRAEPQINQRYFMFQARLKPGVTLAQAAADLDVIAHRAAPGLSAQLSEAVQRAARSAGWTASSASSGQTLYTMAAAVGLLLLIACINVANMLLAKAAARETRDGRPGVARREPVAPGPPAADRKRSCSRWPGPALGILFAYVGIKGVVPVDSRRLHPARSRHPAEPAGAALQPRRRRADRRCCSASRPPRRRRGATSSNR